MKKQILMAVSGVLMLTAASKSAVAQAQILPVPVASQWENYVQVNGNAEKEIVPDIIYVQVVLTERENKSKLSFDELEASMINGLRSAGVDVDNDVRIGDMSSSFHTQVFGRNSARTSATYEVKVNSAAMLGNVYQTLGNLGITNLTITKLDHTRIKEYTNELRVEAMKNSQENARVLAEAVGQNIGKAIYIVDYSRDVVVPMLKSRSDALYALADMAEPPVPILEFKNIKLTYSVTAKYALE